MAIFAVNSSSNWSLSLKVLLMSTGVLSVAMMLKLSVPLILDFAFSDVPLIYSFMLSWLRPPYLYILINCIITSIVASSKLQHKADEEDHAPPPPPQAEIVSQPPPVKVTTDYAVLEGLVSNGYGYIADEPKIEDVREPEPVYVPLKEAKIPEVERMSSSETTPPSKERAPPPRNDSMEFSPIYYDEKENEKPPVSARFAHRKAVKSSPEGKGLRRVSKPKRQDTLESTWRTITEGRAMPLTRHLKKSDTWDSHVRRNPSQSDLSAAAAAPKMKKAETFHERSSNITVNSSPSPSPGSGKLRKEPSLSQDELNRRVEAFIKKFNEEMRLQRQESLNQYQEMIGRGAR